MRGSPSIVSVVTWHSAVKYVNPIQALSRAWKIALCLAAVSQLFVAQEVSTVLPLLCKCAGGEGCEGGGSVPQAGGLTVVPESPVDLVCPASVACWIEEEVLAVRLALASAARLVPILLWCSAFCRRILEEKAWWEKILGQELLQAPKARRSWDVAWSTHACLVPFIANTSIY